MAWLEEVAGNPLPSGQSFESLARTVANSNPSVVLLPSVGATSSDPSYLSPERGRFGLVAEPSKISLMSGPHFASEWFVPPTSGVRVIALGYELGYSLVHLSPPSPPGGLPWGVMLECEDGWILDGAKRQYGGFGQLPSAANLSPEPPSATRVKIAPCDSDQAHILRITKAKEHIAQGEIYQANLARTFQLSGTWSGMDAALALAKANPVAHSAFLRWDDFELVSNSMETFLTFDPQDQTLRSYPIKGTAGRTAEGALSDIKSDVKEVAEHMMIVDLVRNDLGRVSSPGSVKVESLMALEPFRGVYHGTSTVAATLSSRASISDAIRALFPGGSITGAPKRRAMTIIQGLEAQARGFFTGSIFLLTPDGYLSSSILIRTVLKDKRGVTLTVGGGITIGSDPMAELEEINHKASVFREVLTGAMA